MSESLEQITSKVMRISEIYAQKNNINRDDDWYLLKLTEELGELTQSYLMKTGRGRTKGLGPEKLDQDIADEVSDVLGMLLLFAQHNDIDINAALERKWYQYLPEHPHE